MATLQAPSGIRFKTGAKDMIKISLYVITYNEESRLGCTLKAAAPLVDEIIVVDCGSTDKTIEIAKSFGAKVYHNCFFPFCEVCKVV